MPKIRQVLVVLAAAASCIAFNTYRYPVVREMLAATSSPLKTEGTKAAEKSPPLVASRTRDAVASSDALKPRERVDCKDGVCSMPLPDAPTASLNSAAKSDALGHGPLPDETDGMTYREPKSGANDGSGSTVAEPKTPRKTKAPSKKASPTAKTPAPSSSQGKSRNEAESKVAKTPSSDSVDTSRRAESRPNAFGETKKSDLTPDDSAVEFAGNKPASSYDPYAAATNESGDENSRADSRVSDGLSGENRQKTSWDRSSSTPAGGGSELSSQVDQSAKAAPLVPIVRPASRNQESETAAAKAMAGFQLAGQRGTKSEGVRPLPPVGSDFPAEPPQLTQDLVSRYPVTSAK